MAITEWHEPIHECQKGEVQRERCYLEPYFFFNGNLKDYAELLQYAYAKKYQPDFCQTSAQHEEFLEKHPICFHPYDIKKGSAPTHIQLKEWSRGVNVSCDEKHNWDARRSSKRNEVNRLAEENLAAQLTEDLPYFYECVKRGFKEVDESVENAKMMGKFTPHQAESATKGRNNAVNSLLQLTGKDKNYNVKADVDAETKVEYSNVDNLLEAFHASKAEWDKHKQQQ